MGLQLPGWLTEPLSWVGLEWPHADEVKLFEAGQAWMRFATTLQPIAAHADAAAASVWSVNEGPTSEEFRRWWQDDDGPTRRLRDDIAAAMLIGAALTIFAAITLAMKIAFIVQLIILAAQVAAAIASAFVTFGASTAAVPGFIAATRMALTRLIRKVVDDVIKKSIRKLLDKAKTLLRKVALRRAQRKIARQSARIMDQIADALKKVNPRFTPNHPSYGANCVHCVQAYELRRRGLDVSATSLPQQYWPNWGRSLSDISSRWGRNFTPGSRADIERAFQQFGPGSRGVVYIPWKNGGAHVFNVENVNGQIRFVDGQNNLLDASGYFARGGQPAFVRLDDLPIPPDTIPHFAS
jgi:hypothetical protein